MIIHGSPGIAKYKISFCVGQDFVGIANSHEYAVQIFRQDLLTVNIAVNLIRVKLRHISGTCRRRSSKGIEVAASSAGVGFTGFIFKVEYCRRSKCTCGVICVVAPANAPVENARKHKTIENRRRPSRCFPDFRREFCGFEGFEAFAGLGSGDVSKAVDAVTVEIEKVNRFGFTKDELERIKKSTLASYERSYNNREKTQSESFVGEYLSYFLTGEPSPGIDTEYEYIKAMLPTITLEEVNAVANSFKNATAKFAYVTGPDAGEVKLPTEESLIAALDKSKSEIKKYEEKVITTALLTTQPKSGKIVSKKRMLFWVLLN